MISLHRLPLMALVLSVVAQQVAAAPPPAIYPNPPHLATNVAADANLYWSAGDHELIVNGTFEAGTLAGWTRENVGGDTSLNNGTYDPNSPDGPLPPLAGNFSTINDQNGPGSQILYQDIVIPTDATSATLKWLDQIRNHAGAFANTPPLQQFKVEVRRTNNTPLALIFSTEPGDPPMANLAKRSADLSSFAGQRIRIAFSTDQNLFFFNVHLDNISVVVKGPGSTYDVYFGTNASLGSGALLGSTTNTWWPLPPLSPQTTYYWRLVVRQGAEQVNGPLWQFTTPRVGAVDHFTWAPLGAAASLPPTSTAGQPFTVALTARDAANYVVTNFTGPVSLSATSQNAPASSTLLGEVTHTAYASYDRGTVGYAFTPNTDLTVTAFRHFSGEKISLWTDEGVRLASQTANGPAGSWHITPLAEALQLKAGRRYRLGVYASGASTNFARFDLPAAFAHGTIHQGYEGAGDQCPFTPHPSRWWLVDLVYQAGQGTSVPISPTTVNNFLNGVWTGDVTVGAAHGPVLLRAQAGNVTGYSQPLYLTLSNALRITSIALNANDVRISFTSVAGARYDLQRADTLEGSWTTVVAGILAQGAATQVADVRTGQGRQFYRLRVAP